MADIPPNPANAKARGLFELFPLSGFLASFESVPADQVPKPYHGLLVHHHHMTVTIEAYHGDKVDVKVLEQIRADTNYARKILLVTQKTKRVVQFGIVRVHLQFCTPPVRKEILGGQTPLGRILIENNVLRRIEATEFLCVVPGSAMMEWFGLTEPRSTYGRKAVIHCDGNPAIELLEIVAPE